jgi:CubicO group peptidase (beta-lactamase class C family)
MDHAAGLSGMDEPVTSEDWYDWEKMTSALARQKPWWEPGTATGYHAVTQGYLIGEVIRRVAGKSFGEFLRDEVAGPLGADFYVGVPESEFPRIGNLVLPEEELVLTGGTNPESMASRTFANPRAKARESWSDAWRKAELPAVNGHGNARSLVRLQTPLACGGSAFGVDLVSEETARMIMEPRIAETDRVLGVPLTFGLGFALNRGPVPLSPNLNTCFWAGWGGSSVVIDQDAGIAMSYVMNKMFPSLLGDLRGHSIRSQAYKDIG